MKVLEKELDYALIQNVEVRGDFDDCSFIIKKADKGSCVVVWERNDYIVEAEKQLGDKNMYQDVKF